jgi:hypothetical protein
MRSRNGRIASSVWTLLRRCVREKDKAPFFEAESLYAIWLDRPARNHGVRDDLRTPVMRSLIVALERVRHDDGGRRTAG